ncbi:demethylmenaquinone methyltransferase family protein [Collimonas fungivorans]|uniref:Putative 4-hydroxy-4-methyl-2-oxoglutarate aldolase n=2 Tax=Collimonas TaxID=202907 RepID=A0A127PYJ5_9BURK|nr:MULTISPECIES: methyltransferase [Collimonas]AMO93163.1 demethylmenaquinone methyltransferase family protein [Collimonas fungivorans]AMP02824.1 demethylmenaquinone methyltransferase family protein [Collimonas pratensis]
MSNSTQPDVIREFTRISAELVDDAAQYPSSILADVAGRRGTLSSRIAPLSPTMRIAGPALTVEVRPGDNLMIHAAMAIAKPGDVLVIDGKGDETCALMGEIMISQCQAIGVAGVVIFGSVRDTEAIRDLGFPVYAVGANPNGPTKLVPGRVNWTVSVGGTAVNPGDLIVADADGVVVVEREKVASLLPLAKQKVDDETARIKGIRNREQLRPSWLDGALRKAGVLKEGEQL